MVRGAQSDLDVLILADVEEPFLHRSERYLLDLYRETGARVIDVLVYSPQEFRDMRGRPFIERIFAESVVVYRDAALPVPGGAGS